MARPDPAKALLSEAAIQQRIPELAREILDGLPEAARDQGVVMVGLLKGAVIFMADLSRALSRLGLAVELDFITLSSYGAGTVSSGTVTLTQDLSQDLSGRHVLLVDDIIDTGRTIAFAQAHIQARGPASLTTALFMDKPARRALDVPFDHRAFEVPDAFVIGYGGDFAQRYRELPFVGVLERGG